MVVNITYVEWTRTVLLLAESEKIFYYLHLKNLPAIADFHQVIKFYLPSRQIWSAVSFALVACYGFSFDKSVGSISSNFMSYCSPFVSSFPVINPR